MQIDTDTAKLLFDTLGVTKTLLWVSIGAIILNIFAMFFKYWLDRKLKMSEKSIHKRNLINSRAIDVHENIYKKLERLSLLTQSETQELISGLQDAQRYASQHSLYLSDKLRGVVNEMLDYFRGLAADGTRKNLAEEQKLFDAFSAQFNSDGN